MLFLANPLLTAMCAIPWFILIFQKIKTPDISLFSKKDLASPDMTQSFNQNQTSVRGIFLIINLTDKHSVGLLCTINLFI